MNVKQILFILVFCFAGTISIIAPVEAVILTPNVDGELRDFGKDGIVDVVFQAGPVSVLNQAAGEYQGILEFDISGLSNSISSASLDLGVYSSYAPTGYPLTLGLYSYAGDGVIGGSDFGAGTLVDSYDYNGESNIQLDVNPFLQSLINDGEDFMGFNLRMETLPAFGTTAPNIIYFYSLEYPAENPQPGLLNIVESNAVPEPGTLLLIGTGLIGLVSGRRKKV